MSTETEISASPVRALREKAFSIDQNVGSKLRARRRALGMSQSTLAEKIGLTFQQVQKYEKGTNRISASRMVALGEALNVPPSFFFPESTTPTPAPFPIRERIAEIRIRLKDIEADLDEIERHYG